MKQGRWRRIDELFRGAVQQEAGQRQRWLAAACAGDDDLRRQVESLLAADAADDGALEAAVRVGLARLGRQGQDSLLGSYLGPYRIVRELGRGGMSTVYLAERSDGRYLRQVAVKLLRSGLETAELLRRFGQEQQILAALDHPNIAQLVDAGSTQDGQPYFVLEYVEGERLDRYCAARELPIRQRLELFRTICSAVQHAHRKLVIHRDLKPSNILVRADGQPKLLDFGIAKLLAAPSVAADAELTHTLARRMTLSYASPEQVAGGPLSTASDVYSLGVVLYELLTGTHPFRRPGRTAAELEGLIRTADPELPSLASPAMARALRGDLDNIVLKAMRKEPERRYQAVEGLSQDLGRHMAGLPVAARPHTLRYRGGKFVRRHRLAVMAAILVAAVTLSLGVVAIRQHQRTVQERDRAEGTLSFLVELFELSEPGRAKGEITARELLDRGARKIREEMSDQPQTQAELLATIGRVYLKMGIYDGARPALEKALTLRRRFLGPIHPEVAASLHDLADTLQLEGEYAPAEAMYREALSMRRRIFGGSHPEVAVSLNGLADIRHDQGDYRDAEALYREALSMRRALFPEPHPDLARSLNDLAVLLHDRGDLEAAEPLYEEALGIRRQLLGPVHPEISTSLVNLAALQQASGELDSAAELLHEAEAMQRQLFGNRGSALTGTLLALSALRRSQGDLAGAEAFLRQVLEIQAGSLGEDHPDRGTAVYQLGRILDLKGDLEPAGGYYREAIGIYRKSLSPGHPWMAFPLLALGRLRVAAGEAAAAESLLRESLEIRRATLDTEHWRIGEAESALGECLAALGRPREAEPLLTAGYLKVRASRGDADEWTHRSRQRLVRFYTSRGEAAKASEITAHAAVNGS